MSEFVFQANITDRHGAPMIGVEVEAIDINLFTAAAPDPMQYIVAIATTDISGTATFHGLPIGSYFARPRINREDVRIQVQIPSGMGGGGKLCYGALVQKEGLGTHTTIQAAITALGTGGGVIFICGGTYLENLTIAAGTSNLWLIGASRAEVIISGNGAKTITVNAAAGQPVTNLRLEHLTIKNTAGGTILWFSSAADGQPNKVDLLDLLLNQGAVGIDMSNNLGGINWKLTHVDIVTPVGDAGQLEVTDLLMTDCRMTVAGKGLYLGGSTAVFDIRLSSCVLSAASEYALRLRNASDIEIVGCGFEGLGTGARGIRIGNGASIIVSGCGFELGDGVGIDADDASLTGLTLSDLDLVSLTGQSTPRVGIVIAGSCAEVVIANVRIKNFESYGIHLNTYAGAKTQRFIIDGCIIANGGDTHSIYLDGSDYGAISGCVLRGKGGAGTTYGVYGAAGTTYVIIGGNLAVDHDDITNLVNGVDNNIVLGNSPTGGGGTTGMVQHGDEWHVGRIMDGGADLPEVAEDGEEFYNETDKHPYIYHT